ncbi:hypothetical protein VTN00DRAFT_1402 [Thermoascus crustaceus]|uniref:uncharacterized protein n=1 Tax=Thermoascus crustaceus TaxID=5088 RepID=UPI0037424F6D
MYTHIYKHVQRGCSCTFTLLSPRPAAQLKSHAIELSQWVWYVSTSPAAISDLLSSSFLLPHTNQYPVLKSPCKKTTEASFLLLPVNSKYADTPWSKRKPRKKKKTVQKLKKTEKYPSFKGEKRSEKESKKGFEGKAVHRG